MQWYIKPFNELSVDELYRILRLRADIFVVEQDCVYADLDGKDTVPGALHLFGMQDQEVVCCLRILPPGCSYPDMPSLGRVAAAPSVRGQGIGHQMLARAVNTLDQLWPDKVCHISAQSYLQNYYQSQGFVVVTDEYLEDDLPHVGMERTPKA
jgi:ElaA protein